MKLTQAARRQAFWARPVDSHATLRKSGYDAPMTNSAHTSAEPLASTAGASAGPSRPWSKAGIRAISRTAWVEIAVALICFAVLCGAALTRTVTLLEPDDYAYRASIVALSEGHLVLTDAQYQDLQSRLQASDQASGGGGADIPGGAGGMGGGIIQWTQLDDGRWVSEKNPGYPFLAVPFQLLGSVRAAPLFYGALGCLALFAGGRRWLGAWGGTWAVGLFCSSGVALTFAWRAWMPTFTGAALVAVGAGALLWAVLAGDAGTKRRTVAGLLGFLALEGAVLVRYTDVVVLAVAVAAVLLVRRFAPGRVPRRALWWWLGSVGLATLLVLAWDEVVYGGALATGYASGVVTFGLGALRGNLKSMPEHLSTTMPASWLALAGLVWIVGRSIRLRLTAPKDEIRPSRAVAHRDLAVAAALAAAWAANWGLYFLYYWTAQMGGGGGPMGGTGGAPAGSGAVHLVRFFVPAIAPIALLGAWPLARLPRWVAGAAVAAFFGLGLWSFADMATSEARSGMPGGGPGGMPGGMPGGAPPGGGYGQPGQLPAPGSVPSGAPLPQGAPSPPAGQ
jgi:hypothetical protein